MILAQAVLDSSAEGVAVAVTSQVVGAHRAAFVRLRSHDGSREYLVHSLRHRRDQLSIATQTGFAYLVFDLRADDYDLAGLLL